MKRTSMSHLLDYIYNAEWTIWDCHKFFELAFNCRHYRKLWRDATTPEITSMAKMSMDDADIELNEFMKVRCLSQSLKHDVWYLVTNS